MLDSSKEYRKQLKIYTHLRLKHGLDFSTIKKELRHKGMAENDINSIMKTIHSRELKDFDNKQVKNSIGIAKIIGGFALILVYLILFLIDYPPIKGSHSYIFNTLIISGLFFIGYGIINLHD